jgi:hypothetical protein
LEQKIDLLIDPKDSKIQNHLGWTNDMLLLKEKLNPNLEHESKEM